MLPVVLTAIRLIRVEYPMSNRTGPESSSTDCSACHLHRKNVIITRLPDLSTGTGKLCILDHLGLVFIWSCFVSCLLFLLFYVSLRNLCSDTCRKIRKSFVLFIQYPYIHTRRTKDFCWAADFRVFQKYSLGTELSTRRDLRLTSKGRA